MDRTPDEGWGGQPGGSDPPPWNPPDQEQPDDDRGYPRRPGYEQPGASQPGYGQQPGAGQPGYGQPGGQPPGWEQPRAGQHGYGQQPGASPSGWDQPDPGQQGQDRPGWLQPGEGQQSPGWGEQPPPAQPPSGWNQPGAGQQDWGDQSSWKQGGGPPTPGWAQRPKGGSAATGPLPLHPMTIGDLLDGAFKLFKANFVTLILVTLVFVLPLAIVSAFMQQQLTGVLDVIAGTALDTGAGDPDALVDQSSRLIQTSILLLVLQLLTVPLLAGIVSLVVSSSYLGRQLTAGQALSAAVRRFLALLGSFVLNHLAQASIFIVTTIVLVLLTAIDAPLPLIVILSILLVLGSIAGALGFMALYMVSAPAIVVEQLGPVKGLRRSWRLVRGRFWPVLGVAVLSGIVTVILAYLLSAVVTALTSFAVNAGGAAAFIALALGDIIPDLLLLPLVTIVATLVYFDLRIRQEGFDLQLMAANLEQPGPGPGAAGYGATGY